MTKVIEQLEKLFQEKNLPVTKNQIHESLYLYGLQYQLKPNHMLRMELIVPDSTEHIDVQMTFRFVTLLNRYEKRHELLDVLNELNEMQGRYFTYYLAMDGEVYARTLIRVGNDVECVYETMVQGPAIVADALSKLEEVCGEFANV